MATVKTGLLFAAAGALQAHFFDADRGRTRAKTGDQLGAALRCPVRKAGDQFPKKAQYAHDKAQGRAHKLTTLRPEPANGQELADRVRSEVLGEAEYRHRTFNIDAADGVVSLRGEAATPEQFNHLEAAVGDVPGVPGVVRVDSLLYLPDMPPSNKAEALDATQGRL